LCSSFESSRNGNTSCSFYFVTSKHPYLDTCVS
jgi:hypothetical protein